MAERSDFVSKSSIIIVILCIAVPIGAVLSQLLSKRSFLGRTGSCATENLLLWADSRQQSQQNSWAKFDEIYPADPSDSRMKNYAENTKIWETSGIEGRLIEDGQNNEPQKNFRLGSYSFGYNGCEVIASYNFLVLCGKSPSIPKLVYEFETNGLLLSKKATLGSNPRSIKKLLESEGLNVAVLSSREECDKALKEGKSIIFSFWTGKPLVSSIHTVAITGGESIYVLNRYNNVEAKSEISAVDELAKDEKQFITAYTISDNSDIEVQNE